MALPSLNGIKKNAVIISIIVLACFVAVIGRMAWWQIIKGEELSKTAKKIQTAETVERANRGKIYDRNGKVLAESASVKTLVCNPIEVANHGDLNFCIQTLAPIIGESEAKLRSNLTGDVQYKIVKKRLSAEESNAVEELLNPKLSDKETKEAKEENERKNEIKKKLSGIYFENDSKRYYPYNIASHVIGFTGFDNNGIQGIELKFEDYLMGVDGHIAQNRTASGDAVDENKAEYLKAAKEGCSITLTIDESIQHFLEKNLEEAVQKNELKEGAAGIVMNPKTGEILAISSKPDFDCNNPYDLTRFLQTSFDFKPTYEDEDNDPQATERPTEDPNNLSDTYVSQARSKMWRDKTVSDTYEPGSTFKIITAAAAMEENIVNENTNFFCSGMKIVADREIKCSNTNGHGAQTFIDGVKNSCNPVFMDIGLAMGADVFMKYFEAFGLTKKTGVDLSGETSGIYYDSMSEVDLATSSFGQGFQVTPLQLITALSAVVNGGQRMRPLIVKNIIGSEGIVKSYEPQVVNRVISEDTSKRMCSILEKVVADPNATGKNAYVKGFRIAGKTGTSEKGNRDLKKRIASFVGFAPANDPELICLVMLDEPQTENKYGGTIAAPIVGQVLSDSLKYLGVSKQYTEDEERDVYIEVPELRGDSKETAREKLTDLKLKVIVKGKGDKIIDQLPSPDELIEENSVVILYTEDRDENDMVKVPDLSGLSVPDSRYVLNQLGLNFEVSGSGHSEAHNAFAISQTIEEGSEVLPGTVIGVQFRQQTSD